MDYLKLIEQVNNVRNAAINLATGEASVDQLKDNVYSLYHHLNVMGKTGQFSEIGPQNYDNHNLHIAKHNEYVKEFTEKEEINIITSEFSVFLNSAKRLLFILQVEKNGIAFQEAHGYVIFVENKDLNSLNPISEFKDISGLIWTISPTDNEYVISAENEIGDVIIGMKAIQELIDGQPIIEVR